jgi:hypothetical protein
MSDYNKAFNREAKNEVANSVLGDIASLKRRFLKQHPSASYWTELDYKTAKEKVMMAFREYRKVQKSNTEASTAVASSASNSPPTPQTSGRAGQAIAHMVADGFRRLVPSPISVSRSNSNMTPPLERQLQNPPAYQTLPPQGAYRDQNFQSQMIGGPPPQAAYRYQDPRTGGLHPHPPPVPPSQGVFLHYEAQNHTGPPPLQPPHPAPPGSFPPYDHVGHNEAQHGSGYGGHDNDPFDDFCREG